ncbi:MAG: hypothetical protein P1U40_13395 [Coxiellaceae bacterium]|nr:hypothetical protein [Coxiellaceae bacterium]
MDQIPENSLELLCQLISDRFGIIIQPHQKESLKRYVNKICKKNSLPSLDVYLVKLNDESINKPLLVDLCANITVDESYFFRDQSQMTFLREHFFPELINKRRKQGRHEIRIWSAGCSCGQELYSLLIMIDQLIPNNELWDIYAIGTDLNEEVLTKARAGKYSYLSYRTTSEEIQDEYFKLVSGNMREIDDKIRKRAKFSYLNLKNFDQYMSVIDFGKGLDLIICRNVFIYLDYDLVNKITTNFVNYLDKEGVILLGPSDIIHNQIEGADLCRASGVIYYQPANNNADKQAKERQAIEKKQSIYPIISDTLSSGESEVPKISTLRQHVDSGSRQIDEADKSMDVVKLRTMALQCANLADYEEGLEMIEKCIEQDEFNADSYYIKGLICLGLKQFTDAAAYFKSALFLNNKFAEAAYQLSVCMKIQGDMSAGDKMMKSALSMAHDLNPKQKLIDTPEVTMNDFCHILQAELGSKNLGETK